MSSDDLLTIKTGELLAKTEELQEVNQSLDILNGDVNKKIKELKETKQDLKNSDNQLLIANDKLTETNEKFAAVNKELAAVNKEVVSLNKQVKSHQEKQNEFINIISHELKTPIQAIIGYVELLLEQPEKKFEYGEQIMRNAERLQKMISDIRDMSKIDNNALTLNKEQFNLIEVLSSTVNDIKEHLIPDNKRVNIVYNNADMVDKDLIIEADKERIIQVISNLLDNAIKFTKEGTIHIDIEKSGGNDNDKDDSDGNNNNNNNNNNKSGEIIINIKDTGKGLDSRAFPRLFSKFFSTSGAGGTGLGLYICKSIVEAHGGRIWAKNNNEDVKGATFSFSLPLYKEEES
ncbi:MAG: ATP-binding protein [Candidatus Nitrosocosmicus sp.]